MIQPSKTNLLEMNLEQLKCFFSDELGEKPFRAVQVAKWIHHECVDCFDAMTNLSKRLRQTLNDVAEVRAPRVRCEQKSSDGTRKWLIELGDVSVGSKHTTAIGNRVEMVFIPSNGRGTLGVSSQAGCSLDCSFCSTARQGFSRNMSVAEIIGQVWLAKKYLMPFAQRILNTFWQLTELKKIKTTLTSEHSMICFFLKLQHGKRIM